MSQVLAFGQVSKIQRKSGSRGGTKRWEGEWRVMNLTENFLEGNKGQWCGMQESLVGSKSWTPRVEETCYED